MTTVTKMLTQCAALGVLAVVGACDRPSLVEPTRGPPLSVSSAPAAHCTAVRGTITARSFPGGAIGTIDGDLQGGIATVLRPDPVGATDAFITGLLVHLAGQQTVQVTGGLVPELIGRTLVWTVDSRSVDLPPIRRVSNTLTIIEGATGHLISHGILDLPTLTTHFEYEGAVCP